MTMTADEARAFQDEFARLVRNVEQVLLGKSHVVRLAFTAMVTGGHLLLEDVPGTGKTSLARAMAQTVDGTHSRVQFTPDVLPGDITGVSVYDQRTGEFEFHRGPVFASIVLADEINRASPKTQSALLEVMEEGRVTVDGTPYDVGHPFMVIATQNPIEQAGTYALPEAQLDRFLLRTSIGYPDHESMLRILQGASVSAHDVTLAPVASAAAVRALQERAGTVHVDPAVADYVVRLVDATRTAPEVRLGASVRGALALVRASRTWAAADGRHYVVPDDVKALAEPVLAHRLLLDPEAEFDGVTPTSVLSQILIEIAPPRDGHAGRRAPGLPRVARRGALRRGRAVGRMSAVGTRGAAAAPDPPPSHPRSSPQPPRRATPSRASSRSSRRSAASSRWPRSSRVPSGTRSAGASWSRSPGPAPPSGSSRCCTSWGRPASRCRCACRATAWSRGSARPRPSPCGTLCAVGPWGSRWRCPSDPVSPRSTSPPSRTATPTRTCSSCRRRAAA
ncbi:ATPase family associated with various cellular activities (AAA) [Clavibacter michiganensis subsp. michiganensis]|uniref:ATPase family associated with various cellular activities (AAA) n=3 Tax=Clavibacter michiganensis TaxID=28447 RepID=A0A251XIU5_CLAMM|nr:ATPase family associated with various cellular activities (AAA) [Clavibacter michiganensis subsp. michiganensis]OUE03422.1 ATPase family associated with various cellular activities (AAA) [Clavibacter michiganensis subsp. michiganensis]